MVSLDRITGGHHSPARIHPGLSANSDHVVSLSHKWWLQNRGAECWLESELQAGIAVWRIVMRHGNHVTVRMFEC